MIWSTMLSVKLSYLIFIDLIEIIFYEDNHREYIKNHILTNGNGHVNFDEWQWTCNDGLKDFYNVILLKHY